MDKKPAKKGCVNIFQRAISAGYSCIPCEGKRPAIKSWKKYMAELPSMQTAAGWAGNIGIICGAISGGLTCLDFDIKNGDRWEQWLFDVNNISPRTLSKLFVEKTPSGGYHVAFRSKKKYSNLKLASNKDGLGMIETRGEGGYFICAPSNGYTVNFGKLSELKPLQEGEPETLIAVCESYDELEHPKYEPKQIKAKQPQGETVFDKYDSCNNPINLLSQYGWTVVFVKNDKIYLRRPGKKDGISATWNVIPDRFYCFSTSTPFKNCHVYKASAVYAVLVHNGDFKKACKQLSVDRG